MKYLLAIAPLLLVPSTTYATTLYGVDINGVCVQLTCPPPPGPADAISFGGSNSDSGTDNILVNGDPYTVSWSYSASYDANGTELVVDPIVTYTGVSPTAQADLINFRLFQTYYDATPGTWDGSYTETVPLTLSAGVAADAQLCYFAGTLACLPIAGPEVGPGSFLDVNTDPLSLGSNATLFADYKFNFLFAAGTTDGSMGSSSSTPEPSEVFILGFAILGMVGSVRSRRRTRLAR